MEEGSRSKQLVSPARARTEGSHMDVQLQVQHRSVFQTVTDLYKLLKELATEILLNLSYGMLQSHILSLV